MKRKEEGGGEPVFLLGDGIFCGDRKGTDGRRDRGAMN